MTQEQVVAWLHARRPERPAALAVQMDSAVEACPAATLAVPSTMADALGLLGLRSLEAVTGRGPEGADVAMDLLAADAFVTYAFEAAAEEGVSVQPLVSRLLPVSV